MRHSQKRFPFSMELQSQLHYLPLLLVGLEHRECESRRGRNDRPLPFSKTNQVSQSQGLTRQGVTLEPRVRLIQILITESGYATVSDLKEQKDDESTEHSSKRSLNKNKTFSCLHPTECRTTSLSTEVQGMSSCITQGPALPGAGSRCDVVPLSRGEERGRGRGKGRV